MDLKKAVMCWDGKSKEQILQVFQTFKNVSDFNQTLVNLLENESAQSGATWLLKANLEGGAKLSEKQITQLYMSLHLLTSWQSSLHVLQSLPYLLIDENHIKPVEAFIRFKLMDNNKFVRAWAYNGLYVLAKEHPQYQTEAKSFFEQAMLDEPASVKARIRNILKMGF